MMNQAPDKCPLCLHPNSTRENTGKVHAWAFSCPRCGKYYISELLYRTDFFRFEKGVFELACVANEWHLAHKYSLFVLTDEGKFPVSPYAMFPECRVFMIDEMLAMFPKPTEIVDRSLLNLSRLVKHPMGCIDVPESDMSFLTFCPENVVRRTLYYMKAMGLVEDLGSSCSQDTVTITPVGWQRIQELSKTPSESKQGFVAMWFAEEMESLFRDAMKPAIEDAGFTAKRIDMVEHNNKICDQIVAEIRRSRFVVADFTAGRCGACALRAN